MIRDEITTMLEHTPFVPFTIEMSSGRQVPVPTRDHIYVGPKGSLVVVTDDRGVYNLLPILHITALTSTESSAT